ncbi:MAG: hypothetical protein E6J90_24105 [Deltaproteobacteria bacterium]|nr:MAG: hypothetical protein E6J91_21890 [Deltaproteobacteria bacterium]TMQ16284.1 MAG: hypothetical protein E6J90_24105 [Deltaproteobacteria bacterium]
MREIDKWKLVSLAVVMIGAGAWLILKGRPKRLPPGDDSPAARVIGGLVMIAFGLVVGAVGLNLLSRRG